MTDEELKQEAEEKSINYGDSIESISIYPDVLHYSWEQLTNAYIQGALDLAEPREKRITELEATNKKISGECHKLVDNLEKKQNEVAELKSELIKKADTNHSLVEQMADLESKNTELKKQLRDKKCNDRDCPVFIKLIQANKERAETSKQLTKAKELLERLLITSCNSDVLNLLPNCSEVLRVRVKAEQFLKGSEVEK